MFWEKADYDDGDPFSAFRKRQKEKMKLRKKTKYEIDSYLKMFEIRKNSFAVLDTLQEVYRREQNKVKQNIIEQAAFETQLESMLKERSANYPKAVLGQNQLLRRIESGRDYQSLQVKIPKEKVYHQMFYNYLSEQDQRKYFPQIFQSLREAAQPIPKPVQEHTDKRIKQRPGRGNPSET